MEVQKTVGIKLNTTADQEKELEQLFEAFRIGINWSLKEIENRYKLFLKKYEAVPKEEQVEGICGACFKGDRVLVYRDMDGSMFCSSCAKRMFSEYTVRKEIYGTGTRTVEHDLKEVAPMPVKTHYDTLFAQAYAMWGSYNTWRNKRLREKEMLEVWIDSYPDKRYLDAAKQIEEKAAGIKAGEPKITWKQAKMRSAKIVFKSYPKKEEQDEIRSLHDKYMDLVRLRKPVHFPELTECRTVMMKDGFVNWNDGRLYMTLFKKGQQELKYFGKEYLSQFIPQMEGDRVYCNLTRKGEYYFLMYPLTIKVKQPPDIRECDTFVYVSSPTRAGIIRYDADGVFISVKWFDTGQLAFAKRHFKEKRAEIAARRTAEEKMRKIRRRKKKIIRRGDVERRVTSTFGHQLTRDMVDYVMGESENPKILIWDVGNGIRQNFGKRLNYEKSLWAAVQQQEQLKHKAMQVSIPVVEISYNKCNDMICSICGAKQFNEKKPAKVITQLIKGVKNFNCQKCGYEVNNLINQANNIKDVQKEAQAKL